MFFSSKVLIFLLLRNGFFSVRFPFDYLNMPYLVHFLRFGGFFVVNVWCCSYFL